MRTLAAALTTILLAACTSVQVGGWVRAGASQEEAIRDYKACDFEATKATAAVQDACPRMCGHVEVLRKCMELRGYRVEPPLR